MKTYNNILVHCLVNLGDVLVSTSAVALLRRLNPGAKITMMVRPNVRELVENNPVIDEVLLFDYQSKQKSLRAMLAMVGEIRRRNFDLCVSLDRKSRPAILTWLAGIPVRVGPTMIFDRKPSRITWLYTDVISMDYDFENTLQAENYQQIVRGFFHSDQHAKPVMGMPGTANEEKANALLALLPKADKRIALCVKGTFPLKTWPKEYFLQVIAALRKKYQASFYIIGAPGDRDYAEEFVRASQTPIANFCGKTSLKDMVPIFKKSDLFLTVDTGAAHVAATTGVPMVVMYGCISPRRWHPVSDRAEVLTANEPCCPCHIPADACPSAPKPKCLWSVTPSMVLEKCEKMLQL
jgi:lipopolysaccharide heptosyltransferase II